MAVTKLTAQDLEALGALFDESLEIQDVDSYDPIPDGEYTCEVVGVEIKRTKAKEDGTGNKLMASWHFKIAEGEEGANRRIFKNAILEDNAKNMKRFLNDVSKFGVETNTIAEVLGVLETLTGEFCLIQLKTDDKGRQWVTIDVPTE